MSMTLDLENDELGTLFFYLQLSEIKHREPLFEGLLAKMESLMYSNFSIDEIEQYRNKVNNDDLLGDLL